MPQKGKSPMYRQRFKKKKLRKENKIKSLIRFHSANKIDNYNGVGDGRKNKFKKSKRIHKTGQNMGIIVFFLSHCCQIPFPHGNHSPPHLPRMPSNNVLVSGPAVGQLRF